MICKLSPARAAALLVALALAVTAPAAFAAQGGTEGSEEPSIIITERIEVRRMLLEIRVVDGLGRPVEGLGPDDFTVRLAGRPARVEAVDRVIADGYERDRSVAAPSSEGDVRRGAAAAFDPVVAEPRQLVVLFCQVSMLPSKAVGFYRLHRHLDEMLDGLPDDVAAAVVAFDSHLKLHQDFTTDRAALKEAVDRCFGYTPADFPAVPPAGTPSLARHLDERDARRAARAEDALALVAEALEPVPGEKAMIYVGWGLGRLDASGIRIGPRYGDARAALVRARVPAFVLDVTDADYHALETTLMAFADDTGGQFFRTHEFPGREVHRVTRTLEGGRYLLLVETPELAYGWHELSIRAGAPWQYRRVLAPARVQVRPKVAEADGPSGSGGGAAGAAF